MTTATLTPHTTEPEQSASSPPPNPHPDDEPRPNNHDDAIWLAAALDWDELEAIPKRSGFRPPVRTRVISSR